MMSEKETRAVYTIREVAAMLHVNTGFVYQLVRAGLLPALKLGSLKVRKAALDEFLQTYEGFDLSDPGNIHQLGGVG